MGFAGGAMIGVAVFETGPEALERGGHLGAGRGGRRASLGLRRARAQRLQARPHRGRRVQPARRPDRRGRLIRRTPSSTAWRSGSAFQVGEEIGLLVSAAVLLHAFADGLNTVTLLALATATATGVARGWLFADALLPVAGAALGPADRPSRTRSSPSCSALLRRDVPLPRRRVAARPRAPLRSRPGDRRRRRGCSASGSPSA